MHARSALRGPAAAIAAALALLALAHAALHSPLATAPLATAASSHPFAAAALPLADRFEVRGTVIEALDAGPYVYLRLREPSGAERWVVGLSATSASRGPVRALVVGHAEAFESRRLGRVFPSLDFAVIRRAEEVSR